jgi:hypothetical protein
MRPNEEQTLLGLNLLRLVGSTLEYPWGEGTTPKMVAGFMVLPPQVKINCFRGLWGKNNKKARMVAKRIIERNKWTSGEP